PKKWDLHRKKRAKEKFLRPLVMHFELKLQLEGKLDFPRRAEIARWEASRCDLSEGCAGWCECESRIPKVWMIEDVKHLGPELQIGSLGEFRVFDHRKVGIYKVRTRNGVAA